MYIRKLYYTYLYAFNCVYETGIEKVKVRPFIFTFSETSTVESLLFHFGESNNTRIYFVSTIHNELTSVDETSKSCNQRQFITVPLGTNMLHGLEYTSTITLCVNLEHNDLPLGKIDVS